MSGIGWRKLALCAVVLAAPIALEAADGRIPIYRESLISQPGSYYVTRSFAATSGMPAILITTPGVEIDLNGQTVSQDVPSAAAVEIALPAGAQGGPSIRIRNGQLDGGSHGISLQSPNTCLYGMSIEVEHVSFQLQGVANVEIVNGCTPLAPTFLVNVHDSQLHWAPSALHLRGVSQIRTERMNVTGTMGAGIVIEDSAEWVGDSLIVGWPWGDGIHLTNVYSARLHSVEINQATANGLVLDGVWATTFNDLTIYDPELDGIRVMGSADVNLEALWITSTGANGIEVLNSANVKVIHGIIGTSGGDGIVMDNVLTSHLMYNTIRGSAGAGVRMTGSRSGTLCDNNMSANQVGISVGGPSETIALLDNNVSNNLLDGIVFDGRFGAVERNHAARNGGVGIRFGLASAENVYAGNRTRGNSLGGIDPGPPGSGNINGGGNL